MPGRDGTGPAGIGPMSGRGLGICSGKNAARYSMGLGCRRGFGRYIVGNTVIAKSQKELLQEQKELFEKRLEIINKQLETL